MLAIALVVALAGEVGLSAGASLACGAGLSLILSWSMANRLRRPVAELRRWTHRLAAGHLDQRAPLSVRDEFGPIASELDSMLERLKGRLDRATDEKEQLEAVLGGMVEGVLVLDSSGRIVLANPRLRELLSVWGAIEGRLPLEVVRHVEIDAALRAAALENSVVVREIVHAGAEERTLLMHAANFPAEGPRAGTVAVFHDVSEIRHLEQVRREFIANASHELRTPLTSIQGFADTLLAGSFSPDELEGSLQAISRNGKRLSNLIDDLLELSRIESRKEPLRPMEVDIPHTCRALAEDVALRVREAKLDLRLALDDETIAYADVRAVEQVISNLLDNAIKYTEAGGRITLIARERSNRIEITVEDTGVGIPSADLSRIFERFFRVDRARSRALGGTGLGLAIVRHLVQAMGGEIRVDSELGRGSTFRFDLPVPPQPPSVGAP